MAVALVTDPLTDLLRRVRALETSTTLSIPLEAEVIDNEDPLGLNRIRVMAASIWGESLSPWCIDHTISGGDGTGDVHTPPIGSKVTIKLIRGNPDAPTYEGSPRSSVNTPPSEFEDPNVNGTRTPSGIVVSFNDNDGSYYIEVPSGAKVYLNADGEVITIGNTKLDEGDVNIAVGGPTVKCPVTGGDIPCSPTCFVKGPV